MEGEVQQGQPHLKKQDLGKLVSFYLSLDSQSDFSYSLLAATGLLETRLHHMF